MSCKCSYCSGLTSIDIPNSVTSIGYSTFQGCSGLTSIDIPNSVISIGWHAFEGCKGLVSITIPSSVTEIGGCIFNNCASLTSIVVDNANPYYDSRDDCNALIETFTNTLLAGCSNTIIPSTVKSIYNNSFKGCSGLTSITIPNCVTSIGWDAFKGCSNLKEFHLRNEHPENVKIGRDAFDGLSECTLFVPIGTGYAYRHDERFKVFKEVKIER